MKLEVNNSLKLVIVQFISKYLYHLGIWQPRNYNRTCEIQGYGDFNLQSADG